MRHYKPFLDPGPRRHGDPPGFPKPKWPKSRR
jgi:hypothetical protein